MHDESQCIQSQRPPSSLKVIGVTIFVGLFYAMCLFQIYGEQETWPFSYFGMYKRNISADEVKRTDVEIVNPDGSIVPFFNMGVNGYYLEEHFFKILSSQLDAQGHPIDLYTSARTLEQQSPAMVAQINAALREDVIPIIRGKWRHRGIHEEAKIRVRFRYWRAFTWENRKTPDVDQVFVEQPWKDM